MSTEVANTAIIKALDKLIDDSLGQHIVYKPSLAKLTGSITAAILLERVRHYWGKTNKQPFYKFNAPCIHKKYRENDSWQEELGFTRGEFEGAQKKISTRIMKGDKKSQAFFVFEQKAELELLPISNIVVYWRDSDNVMWYAFNEPLFRAHLIKTYNAEITNSQILQYLLMQDSSITYVMQKSCDTLFTESPSEESSDKELKDSSALRLEAAPSDIARELLQDEPIAEAPVVEELEAPSIQAEELSIVIENAQAVVEESASQLEAPECFEISPVIEAKQLDPDPVAPEETPDADVAAVIDEAEELVHANKIALDNCYNEIVRRAFAPVGQPLNHSGIVTNRSKFLRGLFVKGEHGAGKETLQHQLVECPMTPAEIAGLTLWYRPRYKQESLPTKYETLRERCDEFRALFDYKQWVEKGQKVVDQINSGLNSNLEDTGHNNHRRPTEADYAAPDTPLPMNALTRLKEMATVPKVKP
jgi:hypothetical protein